MSDDLEVLGSDGIRRTYDEHYDTMMDVEQDPTGAWQAIHNQHDRIEELEDKLDWVITERDETFALMLDRAQTAEAKLAKAVAALQQLVLEYDEVALAHDEPESMTAAYVVACTTLAELKGEADA